MITLNSAELNFVKDTVSNTIELLDSVHAYDTEEFENLKKVNHILNGFTLEEIENFEE